MLFSTERQASIAQDHGNDGSAWSRADQRFLWNHHLANTMLQLAPESSRPTISQFLIHLIHGAVFIHRCSINGVCFANEQFREKNPHLASFYSHYRKCSIGRWLVVAQDYRQAHAFSLEVRTPMATFQIFVRQNKLLSTMDN